MASVVDDVKLSAEWIALALMSSGYSADFTLASLRELDRFFDEQSRRGKARLFRRLLRKNLGTKLFAIGAYTGEVIRRTAGGRWRVDDGDPRAEINVMLELPDGRVVWPVQRVMGRFRNGSEDSLELFGSLVANRSE